MLSGVVNGQVVQQCLRQEITADSETSVIAPNSLILKPSILLGYNETNQVNPLWGVTSVGEEMLRGMPTKVFRSCFFVNDIKATVSAIYHVTDPAKFQSYLPRTQGIILQIQVDIKSQAGRRESYTYHFFRYNPNPNRFQERQALETPAGVYCPNRSQGLPIPSNIPNRVSANSELYLPFLNGSIISAHRLIDTEFQFTRLDAWYPDPKGSSDWIHYTEIHDFATGLSYKYEPATRQCSVGNITLGLNDAVPTDGNPNLIQIGNPEHFFLLDDATYQYTGEKRCRDRVLCHVWIAEKMDANNLVEHREWYWASSINGEALPQWIPMKLILKQYSAGALVNIVETSNWETTQIESSLNTSDLLAIFDYRRNPLTLLEVDFALADCYRALGPDRKYLLESETRWILCVFSGGFNVAALSFKINNERKYPVLSNLNYLRVHVFETLIFAMLVRPTRISNLLVDQDGDDIAVSFTLLDAAPITGPVEQPLKEKTLDVVVDRLGAAIESGELIFRARYGTKQTNLFARKGSLNVKRPAGDTADSDSSSSNAGYWVGFTIAGVVIGLLVGFFVFRQRGSNWSARRWTLNQWNFSFGYLRLVHSSSVYFFEAS